MGFENFFKKRPKPAEEPGAEKNSATTGALIGAAAIMGATGGYAAGKAENHLAENAQEPVPAVSEAPEAAAATIGMRSTDAPPAQVFTAPDHPGFDPESALRESADPEATS